MTTDTALGVTKRVVDDKGILNFASHRTMLTVWRSVPLDKIPYIVSRTICLLDSNPDIV